MSVNWPIGTFEERATCGGDLPGAWQNNNPFGNYYQIAAGVWNYHDGNDLNLNAPDWNADWHKPIYAMADGIVYFAGVGGGSWGHIICIAHTDPLTGLAYYSRYGHIENPIVKAGDRVVLGQQIAQVGNGDGWYGQSGAHLHFNICVTELMHSSPNQWCGTNLECVRANYTDPVAFIKSRFALDPNAPPDTIHARTTTSLNFRSGPVIGNNKIGLLPPGCEVTITGGAQGDFTPVTVAGWVGKLYLRPAR